MKYQPITRALVRHDGDLVPASWDEALDSAAADSEAGTGVAAEASHTAPYDWSYILYYTMY